MSLVYVTGAGLVKKKGFKGSFAEAGASAKVLLVSSSSSYYY